MTGFDGVILEISVGYFHIIIWVFPNSLQTQQENQRICFHSDGMDWSIRGASPPLGFNHNLRCFYSFNITEALTTYRTWTKAKS